MISRSSSEQCPAREWGGHGWEWAGLGKPHEDKGVSWVSLGKEKVGFGDGGHHDGYQSRLDRKEQIRLMGGGGW